MGRCGPVNRCSNNNKLSALPPFVTGTKPFTKPTGSLLTHDYYRHYTDQEIGTHLVYTSTEPPRRSCWFFCLFVLFFIFCVCVDSLYWQNSVQNSDKSRGMGKEVGHVSLPPSKEPVIRPVWWESLTVHFGPRTLRRTSS